MSDAHAAFSRRHVLAHVLAGSAAWLCAGQAHAADLPTVKVGTLPFGTVQWEVQTIIGHGSDRDGGIRVENVPVAGNDAARIAFLSGSVDTIVTDLLFAARLKAEGKAIRFLPFSTSEGALMVPASSPIKSVADLKGKAIGVAGGPLDKSWLILQAAATRLGFDLTKEAKAVFGAPPLLAAKVESGELDAGLLYWSACARLQAKGYRQLVSVEQLADDLGARGKIAFTGFVFLDRQPLPVMEGFAKAVRRADALLSDQPDTWTAVRPLMGANDDATFAALKAAFLSGIPRKSRADEIKDAQAFFAVMAKLGGPALVGPAATLPDNLYVEPTVFG